MNLSEPEIVPIYSVKDGVGKFNLQKGKAYQLVYQTHIPRWITVNSDIQQAVDALYEEPHILRDIFGNVDRYGNLQTIILMFDYTENDMARTGRTHFGWGVPYWHINTNFIVTSLRNYLHENKPEGPQIPGGWDTLFYDIDAIKKKNNAKKAKVSKFLKKSIGPNKSLIYAPPSENGSSKGGLLYRFAARKYNTPYELSDVLFAYLLEDTIKELNEIEVLSDETQKKNLLERNLKVLFDVISLSDITKLINELEKDQYQNKYKDYVSKVRILVNEARNKKRKEVANNLQRYKNRYLSRTNGSSSSSLSSFSSSPSSSSSSSTHGGKQRATRKSRKFLRKRKITRKH